MSLARPSRARLHKTGPELRLANAADGSGLLEEGVGDSLDVPDRPRVVFWDILSEKTGLEKMGNGWAKPSLSAHDTTGRPTYQGIRRYERDENIAYGNRCQPDENWVEKLWNCGTLLIVTNMVTSIPPAVEIQGGNIPKEAIERTPIRKEDMIDPVITKILVGRKEGRKLYNRGGPIEEHTGTVPTYTLPLQRMLQSSTSQVGLKEMQ
ncbi:hypothetical protein C8J57DRAFT_1476687 [Mycena rebaudengoi]|nr:hypothetical protein C8J57DRAFT_1476687 [Mycena rebaudengoi]